MIEAQEIERRRLAGDIHDGISQRLVTLSYRLDAAARAVGDDPARSCRAARRGPRAGRPDAGGGPRGDQRAAPAGARRPRVWPAGWPAWPGRYRRLDIELDLADTRLPDHIEIALYRIAQEVPAERRQARRRLGGAADASPSTTSTARLEIVDNGVGFDTFENPLGGDEMGGYGVLSMAERAEIVGGRLNIRSRPGLRERRSRRRSRCRRVID